MKIKETARLDRAAGARIIGLCLLAAVMVLVAGCDGEEPQPPPPPPEHPWAPCECDAPLFRLSGAEDAARFTVDPDRSNEEWMYNMGELVMITYKVPGGKLMWYWSVSPPSHLASYAQDTTIYLYMTANTSVSVTPRDRYVSIYVENSNPNLGAVYLDPDEVLYEYGSEVMVYAVPKPGYVPYYWESSKRDVQANYGYQWSDSFIVKAEGNHVYKAFWVRDDFDEWPVFYTGIVSLRGEGTADIFTASDINSIGPAPFFKSMSITPNNFSARCQPHRGYDLAFWRWVRPVDGVTNHLVPTLNPLPGGGYFLQDKPLAQIGSTVFEAHLTKTVSLDVQVAGQGVVASDNFRSYWNPKRYTTGPYDGGALPEKLPESNHVKMTATACPGWTFSHWEIKDSGGEWQIATRWNSWTQQYEPITGNLTVYMNWWGEDSLFHIPENQETHYVKAVFIPCVQGGEILSITYTSDHATLHDGNTEYKDPGELITKPDWETGSNETAYIVHTMSELISADVVIQLSHISGRPFELRGTSAHGYLNFTGGGVADQAVKTVSVSASNQLPNHIDRIEEPYILWQLTYTDGGTGDCYDGTVDLGQTPANVIYVTYGKNTARHTDVPGFDDEEKQSIILMELFCNAAKGKQDRRSVAQEIVKVIHRKHGKVFVQPPPEVTQFWEMLDNGLFECLRGRELAACAMMLLGTDRYNLQWTYAQGCHSYPSTDHTAGSVAGYPDKTYYSDCTDQEELPGEDFTWILCIEGNGPAENFFKVHNNDDDEWYYLAAVPNEEGKSYLAWIFHQVETIG